MQLRFPLQKKRQISSFVLRTPPITLPSSVPHEEMVLAYRRWLSLERERNVLLNTPDVLERYEKEATAPLFIRGCEARLFAPFREAYSAFKTFTWPQLVFLGVCALTLLLGFLLFGITMLVFAVAVLTIVYFSDLVLSFMLLVRACTDACTLAISDEMVCALADASWPLYTILCPLYHEAAVVPQCVRAMLALDYPHDRLQILLLTEEDDVVTRAAISAMDLPSSFSLLIVPDGLPRTKPRACNYGLLKATGDYVVIYDAEDVPDPLQLKKAVLAFAQHAEDIACVQAKLTFYNANQNMLTRWFTAEYALWFDLILPGLQRLGVPFPLGGTSNHFRSALLRQLGGWDSYNVTEDCDLGLRMTFYGLKTLVLDSTTYEEANSQFQNWIRQRSRWIKGYMQTYLVCMRRPWLYLHTRRWSEFLALQIFVGGKTVVLFVNPLMWLLLFVYIVLHRTVGDVYHVLFPMPVLYMGAACLIFGNFFYTYAHLVGCMQRKYYQLLKWILFIPLYWSMASIAAFLALQQLVCKPHYWEKTQHGLHLRLSGSGIVNLDQKPGDGVPLETVCSSSTSSLVEGK